MVARIVGIVGEGNAMRHFMSDCGSALLRSRKREFLSSLDGVMFYNHSFKKNEDYMNQKWSSIFSYFGEVGLNYRVEDRFGAKDDFAEFVASCDVIIDGTGVYYATLKKVAFQLKNSEVDISQVNLGLSDCLSDYDSYKNRGEESALRKFVDFETFRKEWNTAYTILRTAAQVNKSRNCGDRTSDIGWRILTELPGNASVFAQRGKIIREVLLQGKRAPLYLNLANEPCITSGIMTSNCPEMAVHTVAVGGFDVSRLERVFETNKLYSGAMQRAGISFQDLRISLRGFHDQEVMVPIITNKIPHSGALEKLLMAGVDYQTMYNFLTEEVGRYWNNYNENSGLRARLDVNEEIDNAILDLAINGLQSRDKALSVFPNQNQRALCNGFFHGVGEGNLGLFLMGSHRFRNGRVVADE